MNVTDEETKRFLKFIDPAYRSSMIEILSNNMYAPIVYIEIGVGYRGGNYIAVIGEAAFNFKVIGLDQTFTSFKEDDAKFIISYISRRFDNLKLIFSSSMTHIFAESTSNMSVAIRSGLDAGTFITRLFSNNHYVALLGLSENNADFSNELWNIVLSNHINVNCMMLAYVSGACSVSDNIKRRIQVLYESLSDSDKLLLELGEDI